MGYRLLIDDPRFCEMRSTAGEAYLYAYAPGEPDTGQRFVFEHRTCHGLGAALHYARLLRADADRAAREAAAAAEHQQLIESMRDIT